VAAKALLLMPKRRLFKQRAGNHAARKSIQPNPRLKARLGFLDDTFFNPHAALSGWAIVGTLFFRVTK
jgi:arginine exporter protein ArgO